MARDRAEQRPVDPPLDPARTCLLLFDFLEGHVRRDDATFHRFRPVIANAEALLHAAREVGAMVAYAHADHRGDGGTTARTLRDTDNRLKPVAAEDADAHKPAIFAGTPEARIVRELAPEPDDFLVPKHRWSAFHGTYLDLALRTRKVDTLILCGGSTDVGIASTAYAARDLDYNLIIASDACTSPEDDNHRQFITRVFPRMARVRTSAQVLALLIPPES
jgi:nicotinamidase-related amidase